MWINTCVVRRHQPFHPPCPFFSSRGRVVHVQGWFANQPALILVDLNTNSGHGSFTVNPNENQWKLVCFFHIIHGDILKQFPVRGGVHLGTTTPGRDKSPWITVPGLHISFASAAARFFSIPVTPYVTNSFAGCRSTRSCVHNMLTVPPFFSWLFRVLSLFEDKIPFLLLLGYSVLS